MPVRGVIDPSHKEANKHQQGRAPYWYTPEELMQISRLEGPKWSSWTYELIEVALEDYFSGREHTRVSVTSMLGCPRSTVVERKEDYITSMEDFWPAIRGTQVHRTLEDAAREGAIAEGHFLAEVDGIEVSAVIDLLTPDGDMFDYKTSDTAPSWYPYRGQTLQMMYNAFVVRHAHRFTTKDGEVYGTKPDKLRPGQVYVGPDIVVPEVKSASLVYLTPKKPSIITIEKKQPWTTPNGRQTEKKQPYIWSDEEVLDGHMAGHEDEPGLRERVTVLRKALDIYPDFPPEASEVWGGPHGYACPGKPWCNFPNCLAKRYPHALMWDKPEVK
jgi:hypothetical protein